MRLALLILGAALSCPSLPALAQAGAAPSSEPPAAASDAAQAKAIKHMVVLPFVVASGVDEKKGALLDEVVLTELTRLAPSGVKVVGTSDITALIGLEEQKQLSNCSDTSCFVEIGNALGASHMVAMNLGQMGEQFIISAKLIAVHRATVLFREVLYVDASEAALLRGVRNIVAKLADAQGWGGPSASAAGGAEQDDPQLLLWAGVGLSAVGAAMALGLGVGAAAFDASVVGDGALDIEQRRNAATSVWLMSGGSAVGAAALVAGGVLIGTELL